MPAPNGFGEGQDGGFSLPDLGSLSAAPSPKQQNDTGTQQPPQKPAGDLDFDFGNLGSLSGGSQQQSAPNTGGEQSPQSRGEARKKEKLHIDVEKKQLKLFGNEEKRARLKVSDYDARQNRKKAKTQVQFVIIALLSILVAFGAYQALVPKKEKTDQDIADIAMAVTNTTAFPLDRGEGFAKDFVEAYLTVNSDTASDKVLSYYYSGSFENSGNVDGVGRSGTSTFRQKLVYGPTV